MNSPKINQTIMILAVIFLALVVSACSASAKTEKKRSTSKNVKKIELKGEKGKLVIEGSGLKLPKGFPEDMPIYEPSSVDSGVTSEGKEEPPMKMAILKTNSSLTKIMGFYQKNLPENGWNITSTQESSVNVANITAAKGDQVGSISIGKDKETSGTVISINIVNK